VKKLNYTLALSLLTLITQVSCERLIQNKTLEILVKDGNSWSLSNKEMSPAEGTVVSIYDSPVDIIEGYQPVYTGMTDNSGLVRIKVKIKVEPYYLIAEKNGARNVHDGLVVYKIFESQDEVNSATVQTPPAAIGTPMYFDTNADGIVNSYDATYGSPVGSEPDDEDRVTVIIYKY